MNPKNEEMKIKIYNFIKMSIEKEGYSPSYDEIARALSCAKSTVFKFVSRLVEEGHLQRRGRTLAIAGELSVYRMPIIGAVACGKPRLALEDVCGYIPIDRSEIGNAEYFGLVAEGDSMINIGVEDGDIVFVEPRETADDGEIVVALIPDEQTDNERATLKRFFRDPERGGFILHPENDRLPDIFTRDLRILGVAKKLLKRLR